LIRESRREGKLKRKRIFEGEQVARERKLLEERRPREEERMEKTIRSQREGEESMGDILQPVLLCNVKTAQ